MDKLDIAKKAYKQIVEAIVDLEEKHDVLCDLPTCSQLIEDKMTFLIYTQFYQLGRKCSMCDDTAKWLDKFDEKEHAYCDRHYIGRVCECEICKEQGKKDE